MTTNEFQVTGMTCGHCEMSIREEVSEVPGVEDIQVSAQTGTLVVTGSGSLDDDQGGAGRDADGALSAVLPPFVRDEVEAASLTQLGQGVDEQLVPVVERLVPDEVVKVEGLRAGDGRR